MKFKKKTKIQSGKTNCKFNYLPAIYRIRFKTRTIYGFSIFTRFIEYSIYN